MARGRPERIPYRTRALFEDKEKWRALKEEYLTKMDPTEYLFATESAILDGGRAINGSIGSLSASLPIAGTM